MKTEIPSSRIKRVLSKFYLDLAEKMPASMGGPIPSLKEIRRDQRKCAQEAHERATPPEGTAIRYSALRLIEMFPLGDYDRMEAGLRRLFPDGMFGRDYLRDFRATALGLSPLGYSIIGYIAADDRPEHLVPMMPHGTLPSLPPEVERIIVKLHKILPSMFAITVDVALSPRATDEMRAHQARICLPEVIFRKWIPRGILGGGYSEAPAEAALQDTVVSWLRRLRVQIERSLRPHIRGYFLATPIDESPQLPAVEVFTLEGVPIDDEEFRRWTRSASGWLDTIGASPVSMGWFGFKKKGLILVLAGSPDEPDTATRLFSIQEDKDDKPAEERRLLSMDDNLDTFLPLLMLGEFLGRFEERLRPLRKAAYERLDHMVSRRGLGRDFRSIRQIEHASMLLERFRVEMVQSKNLLLRHSKALSEYKAIEARSAFAKMPLPEALAENIIARSEILKNHLSIISDSFSKYLSWRNLSASYQLQQQVLIWSIVVSLATIASLVGPHWATIKKFAIMHFFRGG